MPRGFEPRKCAIPTTWCGKGPKPANTNEVKYTRAGTPAECLQKGFGAGAAKERSKSLPQSSLQRIKYVGPEMEKKLRSKGIRTLDGLIKKTRTMTPVQVATLLKGTLRKKNGALDSRAYNSVLLYLYNSGKTNLPQCVSIK